MSVYVDAPIWRYGRMVMCHMIADTRKELLEMADRIGIAHRWIQKKGHPAEHFDVCKAKRALAIKHGAIECDHKTFARLIRRRREEMSNACDRIALEAINNQRGERMLKVNSAPPDTHKGRCNAKHTIGSCVRICQRMDGHEGSHSDVNGNNWEGDERYQWERDIQREVAKQSAKEK